jgi:hypothetical protein
LEDIIPREEEEDGDEDDSDTYELEILDTFEQRQLSLKSCLKRRPTKAVLTDNNILKGLIVTDC